MIKTPELEYDQRSLAWQKFCFGLANQGLSLKHIAGACGVNLNTFKQHKPILSVIQSGWAAYHLHVQEELNMMAFDDPGRYDNPTERAHIRSLKLDALKHISKIEQKKEELEHLQESSKEQLSALASLSSEELRNKAKALLEK